MLEDLAALLEDESYAALIIAGDVYDRSIPSSQAIDLFGSFLGKIKNNRPSLEIFVIPGNHDSPSRLGFGRELFGPLGIHFAVSAGDCDKPVLVRKGNETCAFFLLPFLYPGDFSTDDPGPLRSQSVLAEEAARRMEKTRQELAGSGVDHSVLAAHLFASGGAEAGSERVFIGSAEQVKASLFEGFDYAAFGHLHRSQQIGKNAWYSGSPLSYSFDENREKCFLSVDLGKSGAMVEKIPIKPLRKLTSLQGPFARFSGEFSDDQELLAATEDYLEICLTDHGITENARDILIKRFPRLLSIRQDNAFEKLSSSLAGSVSGKGERRDITADFKDFLLSLYGDSEHQDISGELELFADLALETGEENP